MLMFAAGFAKAEGHEPLHMNFNQMIDENHQDDSTLNDQLQDHYKKPAIESQKVVKAKDDQQAVDDFVTFEVIQMKKNAVAQDRPVVKRIYNSVE